MTSYKIAFCGSPQVGKCTLLVEIGRLTGCRHVNQPSEIEANVYLDVPYHGDIVHFAAGSGSYLHPESMAHTVLVHASAVIYVLSPAYPDGARTELDDAGNQYYFDLYVHQAQRLGVGWQDVPWVVVLNKTDLATHVPTEAALFPNALVNQHIRSIASKGIGVAELWNRLRNVLRLPMG